MKNFPMFVLCISLLAFSGTATGDEMLKTGEDFPSFEIQAHDGSTVASSDLDGTIYLLYFYPKADTPGCTKEACSLRDSWSELKEAEVRIFGVSYDTPQDNKAFAEKYNLPFLLLSDSDKALAGAVGAARILIPVPKRISYLVGADGKVLKPYASVSPSTHAEDVLKDLVQLR